MIMEMDCMICTKTKQVIFTPRNHDKFQRVCWDVLALLGQVHGIYNGISSNPSGSNNILRRWLSSPNPP